MTQFIRQRALPHLQPPGQDSARAEQQTVLHAGQPQHRLPGLRPLPARAAPVLAALRHVPLRSVRARGAGSRHRAGDSVRCEG